MKLYVAAGWYWFEEFGLGRLLALLLLCECAAFVLRGVFVAACYVFVVADAPSIDFLRLDYFAMSKLFFLLEAPFLLLLRFPAELDGRLDTAD